MPEPTDQPPPLQCGFGRADMSAFEPEMTMFGWGDRRNRARRVHTPLFARAFVVHDPTARESVAFVAIDALLVGQSLWQAVGDALADAPAETPDGRPLALPLERLVLVATHTHSGPSGYGHHFWEVFNAPGFSPPVFAALTHAIASAIRTAANALTPASLALSRGVVPLSAGIAFNRSWFAYNQNRDVAPVTRARRDEATDRTTTVLRAHAPDGRLIGLVHWFATHGTTVHADNDALHPDHKGLVAMALEADGLGVVCAQECCGDVSPNYRWDRRRGHTVGRHDDDLASAAHVAQGQLAEIRRLLGAPGVPLAPTLKVATRYVDFAHAPASARFTFDTKDHHTTPALLGLSMAQGTAEGPGPLRDHRWLTRSLSALATLTDRSARLLGRAPTLDPKVPFIDIARGESGRLLGALPVRLTPPLDPTFSWVGAAVRRGGTHPGSWVPQTLPLQLVTIGSFALVACPFELTTVSGRRLRDTVATSLGTSADHVVVSPYANAYVGYLTTFEEYQVQHYEAGYTLFGPHTLAALQTAYADLARELTTTAAPAPGPRPARVDTAHLLKVRFSTPWPD